MTTKTLARPTVDFYTTSSRLTHAYRRAVKRNRGLARCAGMHELGHVIVAHEIAKSVSGIEIVVLSHAEDDHVVLTDARAEPVVSGAFHLLFTEPTTHPDQIAQWMRRTNIRAESRLHVVKVDDLDAPQVSHLLGRICFALGHDGIRGNIIDAYIVGASLFVRGPKHRMLHVPTDKLPSLRGKPRDVLRNFEIDPDGSFIYWPDIDVHLGWNQFLQAVDPEELRKAQQRNEGFNVRYGAAIRRLREEARIAQSKVEGITERQLRRIEQGECRATASAIADLAKAHDLDVNTYMEKVANAMR
jgi:Protein of unknown function (DUF2442)